MSKSKISKNSFREIRLLGKGSFGKVVLVEKKDTSILYFKIIPHY